MSWADRAPVVLTLLPKVIAKVTEEVNAAQDYRGRAMGHSSSLTHTHTHTHTHTYTHTHTALVSEALDGLSSLVQHSFFLLVLLSPSISLSLSLSNTNTHTHTHTRTD